MDGISEELSEKLLSEKLDTNDVVIKHARRVKAYGNEKKKQPKVKTKYSSL